MCDETGNKQQITPYSTVNQNEKKKKKRVEIGNHLPFSSSFSLITSAYSMLH